MEFEAVLQVVDNAIAQKEGRHLSDAEAFILKGVWEGLTYKEMQRGSQYSVNYLTRDVGPALWKVLTRTFEEDVSKANFRTVIQRVTATSEQASILLNQSTYPRSPEVSSELRTYRAEYLAKLAFRINDVKFVGIAVPGEEVERQESLAQVFVMPYVREEKHSFLSNLQILDLTPEQAVSSSKKIPLEKHRLQTRHSYSDRKFSAQKILSHNKDRVVLLGEAGSGKSTLISYFALMLTEQEQSDPTQIGFKTGQDWLPIVVRIRDWALQPNQSLSSYLRWYTEESLEIKNLPQEFFEYWLDRGQALILLDGLDEIIDEVHRCKVVEQIEAFLHQYDKNPAIITSRPASYRWDFFSTEVFSHYTLEPFDYQQVRLFIDHWYSSRVADKAQARKLKTDFESSLGIAERIQQLAKNPLLLTIIALIHRYQAELPNQRFKLYEKAVETLLTSWDSGKEIKPHENVLQYLKPDDLLYVLKKIAYWIHSQDKLGEKSNLIDQDELIKQLSLEIRQLTSCKPHEAKQEAERFVSFIEQRTGLLNEQERECYGFIHRVFQEYLTAEEIYDRFDEGEDNIILEHIKQHLHNQHWREVLLLLVSKLKKKRAAQAIRTILEANSDYESWLHRDLLFAAWSLVEDPQGLKGADANLLNDILSQLVILEISLQEQTGEVIKQEIAEIFHRLSGTSFEEDIWKKLQTVSAKIHPLRWLEFQASFKPQSAAISDLLNFLHNTDSEVRQRAAEVLGNLNINSTEVVTRLLPLLQDDDSGVRWTAAKALEKLGHASIGEETILPVFPGNDDAKVLQSAAALEKLDISSTRAVARLLALLKDIDPKTRRAAAETLKELSKQNSSVLLTLVQWLEKQPADAQLGAAIDALGAIVSG